MEGSEGLRWPEGERSGCCCCRWAVSSWLADMVKGWDGLESVATRAFLACCCESGSCMRRWEIVGMRLASDSMRRVWLWRE